MKGLNFDACRKNRFPANKAVRSINSAPPDNVLRGLKALLAVALLIHWTAGTTQKAYATSAGPGLSTYVNDARLILRVHAEKTKSAKSGVQVLQIDEVLKGVTELQSVDAKTGSLAPAQSAVVFMLVDLLYKPALQTKERPPDKIILLPCDEKGILDASSIAKFSGKGGGWSVPPHPNIAMINQIIKDQTAEEIGLNQQVIDALLFPEKQAALKKADPQRALYVEIVLALHDFRRDHNLLANLMESKNESIRQAATAKLKELYPNAATAEELHHAIVSQTQAKIEKLKANRYPPVPPDRVIPKPSFSPALLESLKNLDASAFSRAFENFLDSGVLADRLIDASEDFWSSQMQKSMMESESGLVGTRLVPAFILNSKVNAVDRAKILAMLASLIHEHRLVSLRLAAQKAVQAATPDSDIVRQAAFWEPRDQGANLKNAGSVAIEKLGTSKAERAQDDLLAIFLPDPIDEWVYDQAQKSIQAHHERFVNGMLDHARSHSDTSDRHFLEFLSQAHDLRALAISRTWLRDPKPDVRAAAAQNLCYLPSKDMVQPLMTACEHETDKRARELMLRALCQIGDKQSLSLFLSACAVTSDEGTLIELTRGLSRIGDQKALPALAKIALNNKEVQIQAEAVDAFGRISKLYKTRPLNEYSACYGIDTVMLAHGLAAIKSWRRSHPI
jgi:hypothetical protein